MRAHKLFHLLPVAFALASLDASAFCGDNSIDGFEECDGIDDSSCPDACSAQCACPSAPPGELEIHMVDVGQGDGMVIISPDGYVLVLDAGTESAAGAMNSYLSALNYDVDYTLVSHLHADHLGALDLVLANHPEATTCFDSGGSYSSNEFLEYEAAASSRRTALQLGDTIDLGPQITATVVHSDVGSADENRNSVVLRITYGGLSFLLGGDCTSSCESEMGPLPQTDLYKVHHHGSSGSSSEAFLDQIAPVTALISVGAGNSYGHPTQQTLDRLTARGVNIYRTDLDGDIVVIADGSSYIVNGDVNVSCTDGDTTPCGTSDVGACALGTSTCSGGVWGACIGAIEPVAEDCFDAIDGDCDGQDDGADPDCAWVQCSPGAVAACGTSDVGVCALGTSTCAGGLWGACIGAVDPVTEICGNGQDDDCDGAPDTTDPDCPQESGVILWQVGYDTPGTDSREEFVDLFNDSASAIDLGGFTLSDNVGTYTLPSGTVIGAGASLSIARQTSGFRRLYGSSPDVSGMSLDLGNSGDVLVLRDASGAEIDRVAWENYEPGWTLNAPTGSSIERIDTLDTDTPSDWGTTTPAQPR